MERWKVSSATTQGGKKAGRHFVFSVMETAVVQPAAHRKHQRSAVVGDILENASSSAGARFPPRLLCHSSARQPRAVSSVPPGPPGRKEGSVDATLGNETPLKDTAGCQPTCPVTASYNRTLHSPLLIVATSLYPTMAQIVYCYVWYNLSQHSLHILAIGSAIVRNV